MAKRTVKDLDVAGKRVIVRCDFNVPRKDGKITLGEYIPDKLYGIQELHAEGYREAVSDDLYSYDAPVTKECQITLVPYYSWANRGLNQMRVWIPIR